jgi:SAM-dependent methyltransferase
LLKRTNKIKMLPALLQQLTSDKRGLEVGGPSDTGKPIYNVALSLDNAVFSPNTVWARHENVYKYPNNEGKIGKVIINDAVNLISIPNNSYDFIFASHTLEHIANPLKALTEWKRVIVSGGYIILILPEKSACFDHNRNISSFKTLLKQYDNNVDENDLSTLPEILRNHDLAMDPPAGNFEQFTRRSLDNYINRCLHHYVYSPDLLKEITQWLDAEFIYTITEGLNIWFILKVK